MTERLTNPGAYRLAMTAERDAFAAMKRAAEAICPNCRGDRRDGGALCTRCGGNGQIPRSQLHPGERGAFEWELYS